MQNNIVLLSVLEDLVFTSTPPSDLDKYDKEQMCDNDENALESIERLNARCRAILHLPFVSSEMGLSWIYKEAIPYLLRCSDEDDAFLSFVAGVALVGLANIRYRPLQEESSSSPSSSSMSFNSDNIKNDRLVTNTPQQQEEEKKENKKETSHTCVSLESLLPAIVALCSNSSSDKRIRHYFAHVVIPVICFGVPLEVHESFAMWEAQYSPFLLPSDERLLNNVNDNNSNNNNNSNTNDNINHYAQMFRSDSVIHLLESVQGREQMSKAEQEDNNSCDCCNNSNNTIYAEWRVSQEMRWAREIDEFTAINSYFTEEGKKHTSTNSFFSSSFSREEHQSNLEESEEVCTACNLSVPHLPRSTPYHVWWEQHKLFSSSNKSHFRKNNKKKHNQNWNVDNCEMFTNNKRFNNNKSNNSNSNDTTKQKIKVKSSSIAERAFKQLYHMSASELNSGITMATSILYCQTLLNNICKWITGINVITNTFSERLSEFKPTAPHNSSRKRTNAENSTIYWTNYLSLNLYLEHKEVRESIKTRWKFVIKLLETLLASSCSYAIETGIEVMALISNAIRYAEMYWSKNTLAVKTNNNNNNKAQEVLLPFASAITFDQTDHGKYTLAEELANYAQDVMYKHIAVMSAIANISNYRLESIWHDYTAHSISCEKLSTRLLSSMYNAWRQIRCSLFSLLIQHNYLKTKNISSIDNSSSNNNSNSKEHHQWLWYGAGPAELTSYSNITCDVCELLPWELQQTFAPQPHVYEHKTIFLLLPYLPYFADWNEQITTKQNSSNDIAGLNVANIAMLLTMLILPTKEIITTSIFSKSNGSKEETECEEHYEEEEGNEWECEVNLSNYSLMKQLLLATSRLCTYAAFAINHKMSSWSSEHCNNSNTTNNTSKKRKNNKDKVNYKDNDSENDSDNNEEEEMYEYAAHLLETLFTLVQRVCTVLALSPAWKVQWELFHQLPFLYKSFLYVCLTPAEISVHHTFVNKDSLATLKMIRLSQRYVQEFITFNQHLWQVVEDEHSINNNNNHTITQNAIMCYCALNDEEEEVRCVALQCTCPIAKLCTQTLWCLSQSSSKYNNTIATTTNEVTDISLVHLLLLQLINTLCKVARGATVIAVNTYCQKISFDNNSISNNNDINNGSCEQEDSRLCNVSIASLTNLTHFVYTIKSCSLFARYNIRKEWEWLRGSLLSAFAPLLTQHVLLTDNISSTNNSNNNGYNDERKIIGMIPFTLLRKYTDLLLLIYLDKYETAMSLSSVICTSHHLQKEQEQEQEQEQEEEQEEYHKTEVINNNNNDNKYGESNEVANSHLQLLTNYLQQLAQHETWRCREQYVWLLCDMCYQFMSMRCSLESIMEDQNEERKCKISNNYYSKQDELLLEQEEQESESETLKWNKERVDKASYEQNVANTCKVTSMLMCYRHLYTFALKHFIPLLIGAMFDKTHIIRSVALTATRTLCVALQYLYVNYSNNNKTIAELIIWPLLKNNEQAWSSFSHRAALLQIALTLNFNKTVILLPLLDKLSLDKVVNVRMAVAKTIYTLLCYSKDDNVEHTLNSFKFHSSNSSKHNKNEADSAEECWTPIRLNNDDKNGVVLSIIRRLLSDSSSDVRDEASKAIAICC